MKKTTKKTKTAKFIDSVIEEGRKALAEAPLVDDVTDEVVDLYPEVEVVDDAEALVRAYEAQRAVDLGWARSAEEPDVWTDENGNHHDGCLCEQCLTDVAGVAEDADDDGGYLQARAAQLGMTFGD